jgi:hypothetical protein
VYYFEKKLHRINKGLFTESKDKKNDGVPPRHSYLNMLYVRMFNNLAHHNPKNYVAEIPYVCIAAKVLLQLVTPSS